MKFVRIVFLYVVFFFLGLIVAAIADLKGGTLLLFAFGAPALMVWLVERRRKARKAVAQTAPTGLDEAAIASRIGGAAGRPIVQEPPSRPREPASVAEPPRATGALLGGSTRRQGWVPRGETVVIEGRAIPGMVYVGTPPIIQKSSYQQEKCRAYIDPSLPVARRGSDPSGERMPYWPGYSEIPRECRATYLDWLAGGATDGSVGVGYMFLYFYGLERRFFVDDPGTDERRAILDEARRLAALFSENGSARRYLGTFIDIATCATMPVDDIPPVFENPGWDLPLSLKLAIGARLERGETLDADRALSWLLCHPERSLRTAAKRCPEEFAALFRIRFAARFPGGLKVAKPRKHLAVRYEAASREFDGTMNPKVGDKPVPDISGLRKPVEIAQEIADLATTELDKLSRYLGRNPDGRGSVEAHALLPAELRRLFPSEDLARIGAWAGQIVAQGGLVLAGEVLQSLEGAPSAQAGKRQLTGAADALARLGFGLAPDPRFALRAPKIDEPVVLFDLGGAVEALEDVSARYKAALVELALASIVAHADGVVSERERRALEDQARSVAGLTDHERRRLAANLAWFLAVPPDMSLLRRRLKDADPDRQAAVRAALVAAAHADGIVKSEEVAEIEKIYRTLGLDPNLAYSDLHAGEVDAPRRVREALPAAPGEPIPAFDPPEPRARTLDAARIASIRQDTDRVSAVLAEIFVAGDDEGPETQSETGPGASTLPGLDEKHTAFVREIVTRPRWSEDEFAALARRHGLMAAGALESVNEWAFGAYDEALVEEYDGYEVSQDIAEALADALEKEGLGCRG